ncbi:Elongation factor P [Hibiscus syriacus]|uniref:Elongation factor P n=1 Tax=Hibiscus syriacus TaxID=106335 RepID=A0A6A3CFS4_HIBSY|nr:elongation factor P-like [Hibiscus syriacus]KAE8728120.1 Elongation factor P [Hibiscus syriacus]
MSMSMAMAGTATFTVSSPTPIFKTSSSRAFHLPMRFPHKTHSFPRTVTTFSTYPLHLTHSPRRILRIHALTSNDIKVGTNLEVDGAPWKVLEFLHVKPGKGAAFVRTKMRNYITGNTVEKTFRAGSTIEEADVFKEQKQYTYKDGSQYVFMDLTTFEEIRLSEAEVGDKTKWLKEGMDCYLLFWDGKVIDFELPITVQLKVVDVDPGLKGDTASGGSKPATLDTGAVVNVPLFVNIGEEILVDTRTGTYMSRA